jgi:hypothetical protein
MPVGILLAAQARAVGYNTPQALAASQKAQARANIDALKKNYIINGAMMVSQENGTTAGTTSGFFPVDQFFLSFTNAAAISAAQVASLTPAGSPNRLRVTVTTADAAVAAGDFSAIITRLEGKNVADLKFGSAAPKSIVIQFGVKAPAGTYCVALRNNASNRSYVAEYVISGAEANTDVVKTVTLTADATGTWLATNGVGVEIVFSLMCGSTFQQAAGAWGTGNALGSANQFNFMGTVSNVFELFDVGLYEGSAAPAFQVPDFAAEQQRCQRYWEKSYDYATALGTVTGAGVSLLQVAPAGSGSIAAGVSVNFAAKKRATAAVTMYSAQSGASGKVTDAFNADVTPTITAGEGGFFWIATQSGSTTSLTLKGQWKADARL